MERRWAAVTGSKAEQFGVGDWGISCRLDGGATDEGGADGFVVLGVIATDQVSSAADCREVGLAMSPGDVLVNAIVTLGIVSKPRLSF
jgi:hypothetical protein